MSAQNLNVRNPYGNPTKGPQQGRKPLKNPFANINIKQDEIDEGFHTLDFISNKENQTSILQSPFDNKKPDYSRPQEKVFFKEPVNPINKKQPFSSPLENTEGLVHRNTVNIAKEERIGGIDGSNISKTYGGNLQRSKTAGEKTFYTSPFMNVPAQQENKEQEQKQKQEPYDEENEPPLLEDLGIDLEVIKARTMAVLKLENIDERFARDADMSGPLLIALLFGSLLLFHGKISFGNIYGLGVFGTLIIYFVMNLLSQTNRAKLYNTMSILGYCLFPVVVLCFLGIFIQLQSWYGSIICICSILWATTAATKFFIVLLDLGQQKFLVAYPVLLFYLMFALLTIF